MSSAVYWLWGCVLAYWAYCIFWGLKGMQTSKTATQYMIAGRQLPMWVFVLAATATSFSGWTFVGHPGLIYRDGFQYAYASFYAITIPFTGMLFLKRQWMLGKHYGFVTPGEMLGHYFKSDAIRLLVVLVALCFSVPYLGLQLRASGFLFHSLTEGALDINAGMLLLSAIVILYVATGGLRAVAYVDTMQAILLALGIVILGIIAIDAIGGFAKMNEAIFALAEADTKLTPDGYSHYIAIPGVIQFVATGPKAVGGAWTGVMILTYMFALMGIHSSPAFSMWAFSNKNPRPFAPQQVWASSFGIGLILFFFTAFHGVGAHFLGANADFLANSPELANDTLSRFIEVKEGDPQDIMKMAGGQGNLVPILIRSMGEAAPWLVGLLAVCALAAMQSTGAAYMSTAGTMLTRDIMLHFIDKDMSDAKQKLFARFGVLLIVGAALLVAVTATDALVLLGGLAVAFGFQMWTSLIAVCYWPRITRQGAVVGLACGMVGVAMTETIAVNLFGDALPWGRWPLTMHSAFWGMLFNLPVALIISHFTQEKDEMEHRMKFHNFLRRHSSLSPEKKSLVPAAWIIVLVWFFFGIGPGAVIGNTIFGDPKVFESWTFGMPSIWAWQILWWALGVGMMWFLAYKMEFSTMPDATIEALTEDSESRDAGQIPELAEGSAAAR
jgi:Na+/proline symporter